MTLDVLVSGVPLRAITPAAEIVQTTPVLSVKLPLPGVMTERSAVRIATGRDLLVPAVTSTGSTLSADLIDSRKSADGHEQQAQRSKTTLHALSAPMQPNHRQVPPAMKILLSSPLTELGVVKAIRKRDGFRFARGPKSTLGDGVFAYALVDFWSRYSRAATLSFEAIARGPNLQAACSSLMRMTSLIA